MRRKKSLKNAPTWVTRKEKIDKKKERELAAIDERMIEEAEWRDRREKYGRHKDILGNWVN